MTGGRRSLAGSPGKLASQDRSNVTIAWLRPQTRRFERQATMRDKLDNPVLIAGLGIAGLLLGGYSAPDRRAPASPGRGKAAGSWRDAILRVPPSAATTPSGPAKSRREAGGTCQAGSAVLRHRLMTEAAGVTFFVLLAMFPALAASSRSTACSPTQTVRITGSSSAASCPAAGLDIIKDQVKRSLRTAARPRFGVVFGLATSLWSANPG